MINGICEKSKRCEYAMNAFAMASGVVVVGLVVQPVVSYRIRMHSHTFNVLQRERMLGLQNSDSFHIDSNTLD